MCWASEPMVIMISPQSCKAWIFTIPFVSRLQTTTRCALSAHVLSCAPRRTWRFAPHALCWSDSHLHRDWLSNWINIFLWRPDWEVVVATLRLYCLHYSGGGTCRCLLRTCSRLLLRSVQIYLF